MVIVQELNKNAYFWPWLIYFIHQVDTSDGIHLRGKLPTHQVLLCGFWYGVFSCERLVWV